MALRPRLLAETSPNLDPHIRDAILASVQLPGERRSQAHRLRYRRTDGHTPSFVFSFAELSHGLASVLAHAQCLHTHSLLSRRGP